MKVELTEKELNFIIGVLAVHESRQWDNVAQKYTPDTRQELKAIFLKDANRASALINKLNPLTTKK